MEGACELKQAFLNSILKALFRDTSFARFWWCARCHVPAPGAWISMCQVLCARCHKRWASGASLKRAFKMQFRNAYSRSLVPSSQKVWPKPDFGSFAPCTLPCKIGGSQNLTKERYLSNVTFVYLSKCNIKLPVFFGNSKKRFFWTGLMYIYVIFTLVPSLHLPTFLALEQVWRQNELSGVERPVHRVATNSSHLVKTKWSF